MTTETTEAQPSEFRAAFAKCCSGIARDAEMRAHRLALDSIAWLACGEWKRAIDCGVACGELLTEAAKLRALAEANEA